MIAQGNGVGKRHARRLLIEISKRAAHPYQRISCAFALAQMIGRLSSPFSVLDDLFNLLVKWISILSEADSI